MCFVFISQQTATPARYNINGLVFITQMKSVYSAVRTGSLNKRVCASSLKGENSLGFLQSFRLDTADLPKHVRTWILQVNSWNGRNCIISDGNPVNLLHTERFLTWQRLMFRSYGGPTHRNVTSPRDRKMTSHHYSPRRTPLPSPTVDPAPEALLTRSQFPTLSRQFIATIGTFEATRFFFSKHAYNYAIRS